MLETLPTLQVSFEDFKWARMIISSRIFGIFVDNNKTDALVPIADMLNHRTPKITSWFYCEHSKCFVVQNSSDPIRIGEEVFDSYGLKSNSRFLLNYGFTEPNNIQD